MQGEPFSSSLKFVPQHSGVDNLLTEVNTKTGNLVRMLTNYSFGPLKQWLREQSKIEEEGERMEENLG